MLPSVLLSRLPASLWLLCAFCLLTSSSCAGFGTRLRKALTTPDFVYVREEAPPPAVVSFKTGYRGELPEVYPLGTQADDGRTLGQPPVVTRDGWIEVTPQRRPVQLRLYLRNVNEQESEFLEVKSFTGNVPYQLPNEIRFLDGVMPSLEPQRIILRNLKNPHNGYSVLSGALLLLEVIDPALPKAWRYLFEYKDFGSRQKLSFNVVVTVPPTVLNPALAHLNLPSIGDGVGNAAFTMSYSLGYRFRTQNPALRWVGDKVAGVIMLGTSADPFLEGRSNVFTQLSVGFGLEFYDFLSTNLLMDTTALGNLSNGRWGLVVGFDAVRFADFSRKLTAKLFNGNELK